MVLVTYPNGQPDRPKDLLEIQTWLQSMNGKTPRITENQGNLTESYSTPVNPDLLVTNVSINRNTITISWNKGKTMTQTVTSIVLDTTNKNLKFSLASNPSTNLEIQY